MRLASTSWNARLCDLETQYENDKDVSLGGGKAEMPKTNLSHIGIET